MPAKRKPQSLGFERRVKPRKEEKWEPEPDSEQEESSDDEGPAQERIGNAHSDEDDSEQSQSEGEESGDSDASDDEAPPKVDLSSVSFGALARAQASLPGGRKSKKQQSADLAANGAEYDTKSFKKDSLRNDPKAPKPKRSSKHAPQEQTSKRQVTRMREIIPDTRRKARDPRFDPLVGKMDEVKARKAYAFLEEYRDSEMADLRAQIKKTKDPNAKERLKRQLMSMESRKKARAKKDEEDQLLSEHRRKEKELVAQGKQPFYLKKSVQKKQLLVNRFEGMSKGQVDRAIERKRKKVAGKEKKELDSIYRVRDRNA